MADFEWVDDGARLAELVDVVRTAPAYAVDTEFHRERTYYPRLALVQVAWSGGVALVDPQAVSVAPLAGVLEGPGVAVLHAADQDLEVLDRACGAVPTSLFDTQLAAGFMGFSSPSLVTLLERVLGVRLPKGDRLSDWTRRPLTAGQQAYAAADVAHLLDLRDVIVAELDRRGRRMWAEQECTELLRRPRQPQDPDTAWWRLKEARQLRGTACRVAQAVAAWRERRAARLDILPRFVLPDLAVAAMAHRPPLDEAGLHEVRGLDRRYLRGDVTAELLAAIAAGLDLDDSALRVPVSEEVDRRFRPAVALVSAWVGQLAADLDVDPALLATRADLHAFLRGDGTARLATGWRNELVGEPVHDLVDGRAALAFDGRGGLVLEDRSHSARSHHPERE